MRLKELERSLSKESQKMNEDLPLKNHIPWGLPAMVHGSKIEKELKLLISLALWARKPTNHHGSSATRVLFHRMTPSNSFKSGAIQKHTSPG
ncbi:hypothetical protein TNCV_2108511 [Trichonephila clavipes]|nr:hypothetical protein TNCV_2108511 [Trichonephila clavipes]